MQNNERDTRGELQMPANEDTRLKNNAPSNHAKPSADMERFLRDDSLMRRKLLSYLPYMIMTHLSILLIMAVDGIVVGNLVGASALASVSIITPITAAFGVVSVLVASGISTILSTCMGENRLEELRIEKKAAKTLTILSALGLILIEIPVAAVTIKSYQLSPEMRDLVWQYAIGILISAPFGMVSTVCTLEMQILGKTKALTAVSVAEGLINLILDLFFVGVMRLGIAGAGYGTALANAFRCVSSVVYLYRNTDIYKSGDAPLRWKNAGRMLKTGVSEASYSAMSALRCFFLIKILLAALGENSGVIYGVCQFCWNIANMVIISVQSSARPLIGIVTGGGDLRGIKTLVRQSLFLMVLLLGLVTACALIAPELFYQLHSVADLPTYGSFCLRLFSLHFIACGFNAILRLVFANRGDVAYNSAVTVAGYAAMPILAFLLSRIYPPMLFVAYLITECLLLAFNHRHYRAAMRENMEEASKEDVLYLTVSPRDAIEASHAIRRYAQEHGHSERNAYRAALCMEEMIHYAHARRRDAQVHTQVMVKFCKGGCIFTILDDGRCIMLNEDDESKALISNYSLIKKIATSVSYQYLLEMNYTVFHFDEKPAARAA